MKLFFGLLFCVFTNLVESSQSFLYEKMHNFGLGRRVIQNYRLVKSGYPQSLPSTRYPLSVVSRSHQNIYQGQRREDDISVYNKQFNYKEKEEGHHVFCRGEFDCIISHLAVETQGGIPILLRGGVGYYYFIAVAKANPGVQLKGKVRAYCRNTTDDYYKERI